MVWHRTTACPGHGVFRITTNSVYLAILRSQSLPLYLDLDSATLTYSHGPCRFGPQPDDDTNDDNDNREKRAINPGPPPPRPNSYRLSTTGQRSENCSLSSQRHLPLIMLVVPTLAVASRSSQHMYERDTISFCITNKRLSNIKKAPNSSGKPTYPSPHQRSRSMSCNT